MIELNLRKVTGLCVEFLAMLEAARSLCIQHSVESGWINDWEKEIAGVMKDIWLVRAVKGDVLIFDD